MKRTPLKRKKPMNRGAPQKRKRKTPSKASGGPQGRQGRSGAGGKAGSAPTKRTGARKNSTWRRGFHSKARVRFIKTLPCIVCGAVPSENSHWPHRSQGGGWMDVHPLCSDCHRDSKDALHKIGRRFWWIHGIDPETANAETQAAWERYDEGLAH